MLDTLAVDAGLLFRNAQRQQEGLHDLVFAASVLGHRAWGGDDRGAGRDGAAEPLDLCRPSCPRSLGLGRDDILHTAESLFHDHVPANQAGLASCWIHRRHAQPGFGATMDPGDQPTVNFRFNSLADLAAAHRAELG